MKSSEQLFVLHTSVNPFLGPDKKIDGVFETKDLARKYVDKKEIKYYYIEKVDYYEEK